MITKNPEFEKTIRKKLEKQFFMHHIGFDLTKIEPGYVEGELILEEKHQQQFSYTHGGVTATVADLVMGLRGVCMRGSFTPFFDLRRFIRIGDQGSKTTQIEPLI